MGFHWITPFHNIAGMLTESASARLATPMFLHPDQLRGGPRGLPVYESQTTMPSLWRGGWWRVRDIVEQQKIAAWATVDLAARNREIVLWNMYLKGTHQTARGTDGAVKAYVIPAAQHDPLTARKLVAMLLNSGVEVHQGQAQFITDGKVYGPGSFVVSMAQPKSGLVRWMLGRTFYPDNSYTRDREGNPIRPYDMSTDTFAEFMGVRSDPVSEAVTADLTKVGALTAPAGSVAASAASGYVLSTKLNDSFRAVNLLQQKGVTVRRVPRGGVVTAGDFVVASAPAVAEIAKQIGVDFTALWRRRAGRRVRDPEAAGGDVSALRRRQHGRGLDAADVRAVQRAVHDADGRGVEERQPQRQLRRRHPAGRHDRGADRRTSAKPASGRRRGRAQSGRRQHAGRVPRAASAPTASRPCSRSSRRAVRW